MPWAKMNQFVPIDKFFLVTCTCCIRYKFNLQNKVQGFISNFTEVTKSTIVNNIIQHERIHVTDPN